MLFKLAHKLLHVLFKAVCGGGLKRAIGSLVTRVSTSLCTFKTADLPFPQINGMGWHIRMDLKVHLNIASGLGNVVVWLFGPIWFKFPCGIEAIPSVEGTDQVWKGTRKIIREHPVYKMMILPLWIFNKNLHLLSEHFLGGCILSFEHHLPRWCQYDNPVLATSSTKHYLHRQYLPLGNWAKQSSETSDSPPTNSINTVTILSSPQTNQACWVYDLISLLSCWWCIQTQAE